MSSARFATDLRPDPALRRLLQLSGSFATLAGVALALHLQAPLMLRLALLAAWLGHSLRELYRQSAGMRRVRRLRLWSTGEAVAIAPDGSVVTLEHASGSVVLPALAWLRFRFPDGLYYGELLRCNAGGERDWHRLQLLWRQHRGSFGRTRGS